MCSVAEYFRDGAMDGAGVTSSTYSPHHEKSYLHFSSVRVCFTSRHVDANVGTV